ncbi:MAG: hypothetical protein ABW168_23710 [Sedimenticola sp.]
MKKPTLMGALCACIIPLLLSNVSHSAPVAYTDRAAFLAALPGPSNTLDFNSLTTGTLIGDSSTVDGITFNYSVLAGYGVSMQVTGDKELGTNDGGVFQDGDYFDLTFAASNAVGMDFISSDGMLDGDIILTAGGASVGLLVTDATDLGGNWYAYFLGIVDDASPFTTAGITTHGGGGAFLFTVDDITTSAVPLPPALGLFVLGLVSLAGWRQHSS